MLALKKRTRRTRMTCRIPLSDWLYTTGEMLSSFLLSFCEIHPTSTLFLSKITSICWLPSVKRMHSELWLPTSGYLLLDGKEWFDRLGDSYSLCHNLLSLSIHLRCLLGFFFLLCATHAIPRTAKLLTCPTYAVVVH